MSEKHHSCGTLIGEGVRKDRLAKGELWQPLEFGMSEHNAALVRRFQGNGWALTCSPESHREVSAIIGRETSAINDTNEAPDPPELRLIRYEADWADTVLERSMYWQPDDATAPLWVIKANEGDACGLTEVNQLFQNGIGFFVLVDAFVAEHACDGINDNHLDVGMLLCQFQQGVQVFA